LEVPLESPGDIARANSPGVVVQHRCGSVIQASKCERLNSSFVLLNW
jgi:hypothetical protein